MTPAPTWWFDPDLDAVRVCPACQILPAAEGDRYCEDCGSARDRSAWAELTPDPAEVRAERDRLDGWSEAERRLAWGDR